MLVKAVEVRKARFWSAILPWCLIGLLWLVYFVANLMSQSFGALTGIIRVVIDNGMILALAIAFFVLWRKAGKATTSKTVFVLLLIAHCSLFITVTIYYGIYAILRLSHAQNLFFFSILDDIFFTGYLLFSFLALLLIFLSSKLDTKKSIRVYVPVIFTAVILFVISFFDIKWNVNSSSIIATVYNFAEKILEIACIIVASCCVATSKNKGVFYLTTGLLVSVIIEVVLAFGMFSQKYGVSSIAESGWILGELLSFYGVVILFKSDHLSRASSWLSPPDSIRAQSAYWCFMISLLISFLTISVIVVVGPGISYSQWMLFLPTIVIVCTVFAIIVSNLVANKITFPFRLLKNMIDGFLQVDEVRELSEVEMKKLYLTEFKQLHRFIAQSLQAIQEKRAAEKALYELSAQVAHDIRSPLTALNTISQNISELAEEKRILIRGAVQRIGDIANDLASKKSPRDEDGGGKYGVSLLSGLIESLVSEKRVHFRSRLGLSIESKLGKDSYGLFAKIKPNEFKRVLSNLINNAVDAVNDSGEVSVTMHMSEGDKNAHVIVSDNGKGIPPEILPKLMAKGVSYGKENHETSGAGLGLYHARENIMGFSGDIEIQSEVGKGTDVIIKLPLVPAPDWFLPEISINWRTKVVILDDDDSIHHIWQNRFDSVGVDKKNIFHFTRAEEIEYWHNSNEEVANSDILFLCDYELLGEETTGLQVIETLGVQANAVLVTSRFEEQRVRQECARLGVKLLPKNLAGFVAIKYDLGKAGEPESKADRLQTKLKYDGILIDDDELIRRVWSLHAQAKQKKILTFENPEDFFSEIEKFDRGTNIYIDSNLESNVKGEEVSKEIYEKGFKNIYLETGYIKEYFPEMSWIKDILSKSPPW